MNPAMVGRVIFMIGIIRSMFNIPGIEAVVLPSGIYALQNAKQTCCAYFFIIIK
jgi:hypothetical protein